jgi:hypothetical protein
MARPDLIAALSAPNNNARARSRKPV